jgi:hypothetical protein
VTALLIVAAIGLVPAKNCIRAGQSLVDGVG